MKIFLPSGYTFEGSVEEFKIFSQEHPDLLKNTEAMNINKQLIELILKKDPRNYLSLEHSSFEQGACVLTISEKTHIILNVTKEQKIGIYFLIEIDESEILLRVENFNCHKAKEVFNFTYDQHSLIFVVNKELTTQKTVFLSQNANKANESCKIAANTLSDLEKIAKYTIKLLLTTLNNFIENNLNGLSIKNFGYINF